MRALSLANDFHWDGTTSDLAQQYYRRFLANATAPQLVLSSSTLPDAIQKRLDAVNATFSQLPGLLQRALVWDSGFAVGPENQLVGIQTLKGVSMAEIAVPKTDYLNVAGCTSQNCTQSDGAAWVKSLNCNGLQVFKVAKCLVDDFDDSSKVHLSMWATGGVDTMVPDMRVVKHEWNESTTFYTVAAIHTDSLTNEPPYFQCASENADRFAPHVGSIVIPCYPHEKVTDAVKATMQPPAQGAFVTSWLAQYGKSAGKSDGGSNAPTPTANNNTESTKSGFNMLYVLIPILVIIVILAIIAFRLYLRRVRERARDEAIDGGDSVSFVPLAPSPVKPATHRASTETGASSSNLYRPSSADGGQSTISAGYKPSLHSADEYDSSGSNSVMKILLGDPNLVSKQIAYDKIHYDDLISKGAFGEVWVGYYDRRVVALKRLLQNKQQSFQDVEMFAQEIQLCATLEHPNIAQFVGVAWNSLENLVMVMEYLPRGDLAYVLRTSGHELSWDNQKLSMAHGLASALAYMHIQSPVLIHRDLKSRNVLLSDEFVPKLIDFGVSRRIQDKTMTAGVGTPFWTAPEILEGTRYTEKSDIYSLGVLMTELDTCQLPYYDAIGEDGVKLKHFQILNLIMAGSLRPSLTESAPFAIRKIVGRCLQQDPEERPTALEVVRMLRILVG